MKANHLTHYYKNTAEPIHEFEDALHHSMLRYSLRHLAMTGIASQEDAAETLLKCIRICALAGENSKIHFKQIYVFDAITGEMNKEWLMSKKGFNILLMQYPANEKIARWLWRLSDL